MRYRILELPKCLISHFFPGEAKVAVSARPLFLFLFCFVLFCLGGGGGGGGGGGRGGSLYVVSSTILQMVPMGLTSG